MVSRSRASRSAEIYRAQAAPQAEHEVTAMSNVDTRQVSRDSLFLLAQVKVGAGDTPVRVKVRNLSAGGMMAEGEAIVSRGERVHVELRNIGWVEGTIAWKQGDRFGIAFVDEIDPKVARASISGGTVRHDIDGNGHRFGDDERTLRKL